MFCSGTYVIFYLIFCLWNTHQAGIVGVEEEKRQHPPSEPKRRIVGRHVGVHIEAYPSTINVTEAIFDFPSQTWDIKLSRVIFGCQKSFKYDPLSFHISGLRWKFKNRLGDVNCTGISYKPHTQMPLWCKQYWLQGGVLAFLVPQHLQILLHLYNSSKNRGNGNQNKWIRSC